MGKCVPWTRIGYVKQQITRELALDVEVPLLHIRGGITIYWRFVAIPLHVDQVLSPPEGGVIRRSRSGKDLTAHSWG